MKNKIIITGMGSAGSTLCFNLVREALENLGYNVVVSLGGLQTYVTNRGQKVDFLIVKQHDFGNVMLNLEKQDPNSANEIKETSYVINTRRDLRDCVASSIRRNKKYEGKDAIELCKGNINFYNQAKLYENFEWVYEEYKKNPPKVVLRILKGIFGKDFKEPSEDFLLRTVVNCENIKNKDIPNNHITEAESNNLMFRKTFMSKNHVSNNGKIGGYKDTLSSEDIQKLENEYGDWLKEKGYM
jgi:hypothetical protein